MEISFTKNQYQTLLQLLYPGEWVVSLTTHRLSLTAKPQVGSWQLAKSSPPSLPPSLGLQRTKSSSATSFAGVTEVKESYGGQSPPPPRQQRTNLACSQYLINNPRLKSAKFKNLSYICNSRIANQKIY